jgi:hypothetical protein
MAGDFDLLKRTGEPLQNGAGMIDIIERKGEPPQLAHVDNRGTVSILDKPEIHYRANGGETTKIELFFLFFLLGFYLAL